MLKKGILSGKEKISSGIYLFTIREPVISAGCSPGQFITIAVKNRSLRRPFSIFQKENDSFKILFRVIGEGTRILSNTLPGKEIDILGPLGRGFKKDGKCPLFAAGGMGIAPLYFLSLTFSAPGTFLHGTYSPDEFLDLSRVSRKGHRTVTVSETRDSRTVTDILPEYIAEADVIYTAGPKAMMRKVAGIARKNNKKCYVSWEERMGCGMGLCQSCAVKTLDGYRPTCSDGPVFDADYINWDEN